MDNLHHIEKTMIESKDNIPLLSNFNQVILLDENATIVESCDSIFNTQDLHNTPVTEWLPFIESIFDSLIKIKVGTPELLFTKVQEPYKDLPGFYDFSFVPVSIQGKKHILWTIFDYTSVYKAVQQFQQLHHDLEIRRQRLEIKVQLLLSKNRELIEGINSKADASKVKLLIKANTLHLSMILAEFPKAGVRPYRNFASFDKIFDFPSFLENFNTHYQYVYHHTLNIVYPDKIPARVTGIPSILFQVLYSLAYPLSKTTNGEITLMVNAIFKSNKYYINFEVQNPFIAYKSENVREMLKSYDTDKMNGFPSHLEDFLLYFTSAKQLIQFLQGTFIIKDLNTGGLGTSFTMIFEV